MKAKTFEKLLRTIVREEIDYSLRREIKTLKEDIHSELKPLIIEHNKNKNIKPTGTIDPIPEVAKSSLREKIMGKKPLKRPTQNFSSNSTLNDLLNETAQGSTNTETSNSPVNIAQPFASGAPLPTEGIPTEVADAITRDYSGLMKAINKKKAQ